MEYSIRLFTELVRGAEGKPYGGASMVTYNSPAQAGGSRLVTKGLRSARFSLGVTSVPLPCTGGVLTIGYQQSTITITWCLLNKYD